MIRKVGMYAAGLMKLDDRRTKGQTLASFCLRQPETICKMRERKLVRSLAPYLSQSLMPFSRCFTHWPTFAHATARDFAQLVIVRVFAHLGCLHGCLRGLCLDAIDLDLEIASRVGHLRSLSHTYVPLPGNADEYRRLGCEAY